MKARGSGYVPVYHVMTPDMCPRRLVDGYAAYGHIFRSMA